MHSVSSAKSRGLSTAGISTRRFASRRRRSGGLSIIYLGIAMVMLCAIVSLAVDLARVQAVKTELRAAVDAAARASAASVESGLAVVREEAISWAARNSADGRSVALQSGDVEVGNWDGSVFTPSVTGTGSAVRITARLSSARGNAVPLLFARLLGPSTCDVTASAVATCSSNRYGMVGLNYIKMKGNPTTGYWSDTGLEDRTSGGIASNGDIELSGSTMVYGDAQPGPGRSVSDPGKVTGSTASLPGPLYYAPASFTGTNDNDSIPNGVMAGRDFQLGKNKTATIPSGNYYFENFSVGAGGVLNLTGPTTIYVYGNVEISGHANTAGNLPANLRIVMGPSTDGSGPGSINVGGTGDLYANIYAPQSPIVLSGTGGMYGSIVGLSVDMTGTSDVHYDLSAPNYGGIRIVK